MYLYDELSGARFSSCMTYRYYLWRWWDKSRPSANFLMLNPSTADEVDDDPTVSRCGKRAANLGFGGVVVTNIFALRSRDPSKLYVTDDPIGPENDEAILEAAHQAGIVICAWGQHGAFVQRATKVTQMLTAAGIDLHCLRLNKDGSPAHPLYVPLAIVPRRFCGEE